MATSGSIVTKQQMADDINALTTSKNNSIVWSSTSHGLGAAVSGWSVSSVAACIANLSTSLTAVATSDIASVASASDIVTVYKNLAKASTRIRLYRQFTDFLWGNGCANQNFRDVFTANTVTAFTSAFEVAAVKTAIDNISGPASNDALTSSSINNFVTSLTTEANNSTSTSYLQTCNRTACHCNCHTSCHASRARR